MENWKAESLEYEDECPEIPDETSDIENFEKQKQYETHGQAPIRIATPCTNSNPHQLQSFPNCAQSNSSTSSLLTEEDEPNLSASSLKNGESPPHSPLELSTWDQSKERQAVQLLDRDRVSDTSMFKSQVPFHLIMDANRRILRNQKLTSKSPLNQSTPSLIAKSNKMTPSRLQNFLDREEYYCRKKNAKIQKMKVQKEQERQQEVMKEEQVETVHSKLESQLRGDKAKKADLVASLASERLFSHAKKMQETLQNSRKKKAESEVEYMKQNYVGSNSKTGLSQYLHSARSRQNIFERLEEDRINRTQRVFIDSESDSSSSKPKTFSKFRPNGHKLKTSRSPKFPFKPTFLNLKVPNPQPKTSFRTLKTPSKLNEDLKLPITPYYWPAKTRNMDKSYQSLKPVLSLMQANEALLGQSSPRFTN